MLLENTNKMFTVLLSVYDKENPSFLIECLDSVLAQSISPTEIILIKDGLLTDNLDRVISQYSMKVPILKVIELPINQGLGRALNEGLKHCSTDIIIRMDTDDIAKSDRFEKQVAIFENNSDIDVVGSWIDEFEEDVCNIISRRKLPEFHEEVYNFAKSRSPINHPTVAFRKEAVVAAGGYKHFPFFEDYYLWVRMLMNGAKFYNIQESLLYFRFSPNMFKRRGGWKYALSELKFQNEIRKIGFISSFTFIKNSSIRFVSRIIPNSLRSMLYKKILRK